MVDFRRTLINSIVKGKGQMTTFWLKGIEGYNYDIPVLENIESHAR
jgi:hypothetical protein